MAGLLVRLQSSPEELGFLAQASAPPRRSPWGGMGSASAGYHADLRFGLTINPCRPGGIWVVRRLRLGLVERRGG